MNNVLGLLNRLALGTSAAVEDELDDAVAMLPPNPTDAPAAGKALVAALSDAVRAKQGRTARSVCTVLSAPQVADPSGPVLAPVLAGVIAAVIDGLKSLGPSDADTAFALLDVVATVASASGEARTKCAEGGIVPVILETAKAHKTNDDVLFGVTFSLHTLTMDTLIGKQVIENGGLQILVAIFIAEQKRAAKAPQATLQAMAESRASSPAKYAKSAALNVMKAPFDVVDEKLKACNFGRFGEVIAADDLKWQLQQERKKALALLASFRAARAASASSAATGRA